MNILVVESDATRRADFVDAVCELPGIVVRGAAAGLADARRIIAAEQIDAVAVGALPDAERVAVSMFGQIQQTCSVVVINDRTELVAELAALIAAGRGESPGSFRALAARSKALAFERASPLALEHHLRVAQPDVGSRGLRGMQTVVLQDWLPAMCKTFATVIPGIVELVPIMAGDTPPVRCVPEILEHVMLDMVLKAAAKLPWGGTVWLTTEHVSSDTVRIDVLENGLGTGHDLTLSTSAPASS